jgi:hypothetical protein
MDICSGNFSNCFHEQLVDVNKTCIGSLDDRALEVIYNRLTTMPGNSPLVFPVFGERA